MNVDKLEELLNSHKYIEFIKSLPKHRDYVSDVEDWLQWYNNDVNKLSSILEKIAYKLLNNHQEVIYPLETIIVPRYPFTKRPIITWSTFQDKSFNDYEVNKVKFICSKLGNLINTGFITRNIFIIDVEVKDNYIKKIADVETKRGFHILRYLDKYESLELRLEGEKEKLAGLKLSFRNDKAQIDVFSGRFYLESYPLQSRYLEYANNVLNVRSYKLVSNISFYAFKSADLTPLKANPSEIEELLRDILKYYGFEKEANSLRIIPLDKPPSIKPNLEHGSGTPKKKSFYNINYIAKLPILTYREFKDKLLKHIDKLPVCVKKSLFDNIPRGVRFFHGQLLRAILPHLVYLNNNELIEVLNDWYSRCGKTKSDMTKSKYGWLYYTGKLVIDKEKLNTASKLRIRSEVWSSFQSAKYCEKCLLSITCLKLNDFERKKLIIDYIQNLL